MAGRGPGGDAVGVGRSAPLNQVADFIIQLHARTSARGTRGSHTLPRRLETIQGCGELASESKCSSPSAQALRALWRASSPPGGTRTQAELWEGARSGAPTVWSP